METGEVLSPFSPQDVGSTFQNQIVKKLSEIFPIFLQILVEGSFLDQKQKRELENIEISAFDVRFSKSRYSKPHIFQMPNFEKIAKTTPAETLPISKL